MTDPILLAYATASVDPLIRSFVVQTRLVWDPTAGAWLKCEQDQVTGSFKWRGALSKLAQLPRGTSVIAASTGNHGLAVAQAATMFGHQASIYIPDSASSVKKQKLREAGVEIVEVQGDSLAAELAGKAAAQATQRTWISPYNDPQVIAGQGTISLEVLATLPDIQRIFITVGGGGLIAGMASTLRTHRPDIEIIGCQPAHSPEMSLSVRVGHVVDDPRAKPTLSDGSAGPLESDSITFPICQALVDRWILVSEREIALAIRQLHQRHGMLVEGAAGVAYAAAIRERKGNAGVCSAVMLCGGNLDPRVAAEVLAGRYPAD